MRSPRRQLRSLRLRGRALLPGRSAPIGLLLLLLVLAAALPAGSAAAQDFVIEQQLFVPRRFFVGDRVELRLRIDSEKNIVPPDELPRAAWISIHEVSLHEREDEREVRIVFSSFYPGTQTLPPVDLGGFVLSDVKIHTDSVLPERATDPAAGKGQILPPGTRLFFGSLLAGGAFLLLLCLVAAPWSVRTVRSAFAFYREYRPYRRFGRALQDLAARNEQMDGRAFYIRLLDELRVYLSARIGEDVRTATSGEIDMIMRCGEPEGPDGPFLDESTREYLTLLFRRGDAVKFGGAVSPIEQREEDLHRLGETLRDAERSRRDRKRERIAGVRRRSGKRSRTPAARRRRPERRRAHDKL